MILEPMKEISFKLGFQSLESNNKTWKLSTIETLMSTFSIHLPLTLTLVIRFLVLCMFTILGKT